MGCATVVAVLWLWRCCGCGGVVVVDLRQDYNLKIIMMFHLSEAIDEIIEEKCQNIFIAMSVVLIFPRCISQDTNYYSHCLKELVLAEDINTTPTPSKNL